MIFCVVKMVPSPQMKHAALRDERVPGRARASLEKLFPPPSQTTHAYAHAYAHTHVGALRMADDSSNRTEGEAQRVVSSSHLSEAPLVELPKAQSRLRGKDVWAKTSAVVCVLRRPG